MVRHRLSGGEQRGVLVVGVTAMTFLNKDDKIVFCHPYRVIRNYCVNARGQLEYSLEVSKGKLLVYIFDSPEAGAIVTSIDRSSLRLEKVISATTGSGGAAPPKSPRGGPSLADAEGEAVAAMSDAPVVQARTKISDVQGMRFNVKTRRDGQELRVVAVVNETGLLLIDPSVDKGGTGSVACQKFPWDTILRTQVGEKTLTVESSVGTTILYTPDAHSLAEEIKSQSTSRSLESSDTNLDKVGQALARGCRFSIMYPDPKEDRFGLVTSHDMEGIKTQDFAPRAWEELRRRWGVVDIDYLEDWDPSHNPRRSELTPGAKDGKAVVYSRSRRFVALEMTKAESAVLQKHTEAYFNHITQNETSVLMRIIGHHVADGIHFCVYLNPVHGLSVNTAIYDIHPSGRRVAPASARGRPAAHLLDRDFRLDHRTVFSNYRTKKTVLLHLAQDAAFLARLGCSEFIVEVSVATFDRETQLPLVRDWLAAIDKRKLAGVGAILSPLEDEAYVVTITHCFGSGSDPAQYCQSLYNFCKKRVFSSPDPNIADIEFEKYYTGQVQSKALANLKSERK